MKKITDPKLLKELYDTEADWKLLIGHRFKGSLGPSARGRKRVKRRGSVASRNGKRRF
jgi:hypothetical protein